MRIPSGDLVPPRRRRRLLPRRRRSLGGYAGPPYAGPRRSPLLPVLLAVALLAAAVGGSLWLRRLDAGAAEAVAGPCPSAPAATPPPAVALPQPAAVGLLLLNGTGRDGLAGSVGQGLAARGFRLLGTGNTPQPVAGPTRVVFGPGGRPGATLLVAHLPGAELVPTPSAPPGSVQVQLGTGFAALATSEQAAAAVQRLTAPPTPLAAGPSCP